MNSSARSTTLVIVGLGNIGSQLVPLVARMPEITHLILVDPDRYDESNLASQNITRGDVGRLKVDVMAERVACARSDLSVTTYPQPVQDVPPGLLRADLMICGVDSRAGRQALNSLAFRLDVPWIDGAVDGERWLGRVAVYAPPDACIECRWDENDYRALETVYPCQAHPANAATSAPPELGALVAAYQLIAAREWLAGECAGAGREVFLNARSRESTWARFARNPDCRFDHSPIAVQGRVPASLPLAGSTTDDADALSVPGHAFVHALTCAGCRSEHRIPPVLDRGFDPGCCRACGSQLLVSGFALRDRLPIAEQAAAGQPARALADLGVRAGDIVTLHRQGGTLRHLEAGESS